MLEIVKMKKEELQGEVGNNYVLYIIKKLFN